MRVAPGERQLRWAFAVALALHGLALVAAARLPAEPTKNDDLDEIQVFDKTAPIVVSPIDLVEWSPPRQPEPEERVSLPVVPERSTRTVRETHGPQAKVERHTPPALISRTEPAGGPTPLAPVATPKRAPQVSDPGGGGGGPVDIGSRSSNGELTGVPSGRTPTGGLPGNGAGSGSGTGVGSGSGSGSGSGTGSGEGNGTGSGSSGGTGKGTGTGGEKKPFQSTVAEVVELKVLRTGTLNYPESAAEEGVQGTVKLKVLVTETGSVAEVQMDRSSGDGRLDRAAMEWVRGWKYRPAAQNGKARPVYTYATVEFELK